MTPRLRRGLRILGTTVGVTASLPLFLSSVDAFWDARHVITAVLILGGVRHFYWFMFGALFISLLGMTLRWVCRPRSNST